MFVAESEILCLVSTLKELAPGSVSSFVDYQRFEIYKRVTTIIMESPLHQPVQGMEPSTYRLSSSIESKVTDVASGNAHDEQLPESVDVIMRQLDILVTSPNPPRADGGKDAWLFLAGCFVFEALVWGFPFSFGVFQSYYTNHSPFSAQPNGIAAIGTCSSGVMYLWAPVSLYVLERWPSVRRLSSVFGLIFVAVSLVASSFATKVWHLIITQGVMYAIGGSFLYTPTMFYLDEWFVQKKGLAFGIMWAGVGTSGLIFPFLLDILLNKFGHATTIRIWTVILLSLCTPLIYFIKPRLPVPNPPLPHQPVSYAFIASRTHLTLQVANILESLGFFLPSIYLPLYATSLSLPPYTGILLLSLLNGFSVLGAIALGALCDRLHVTTVIAISTVGSAISVFVFWGMAVKLPLLVVFAATYGFFAGGFSAIWTGMMKEIQRGERGAEAKMGTLMGLFAAGRGVGAVLSGPVSEVLLKSGQRWVGTSGGGERLLGYGTKYAVLIVFTGVSALCGLVAFGARGGRRTDDEYRLRSQGGEQMSEISV